MEKCMIKAAKRLTVRQKAPDFVANGVDHLVFKTIKLADYRGKYVILMFYPADFSLLCPTELHAFSDRAEEFRNLGCEVLGCSTDSEYTHNAWMLQPRRQGGLEDLDFPLISDKTMHIARQYGVLDETTGFAERALFIIDRQGIIRQISTNDVTVGRNVEEALRLLQAYQFTDDFGEVCPINWKPGHKTIKLENKNEYFAYAN